MQKHTVQRSNATTRQLSNAELSLAAGGIANYIYGSLGNTAYQTTANTTVINPINGGGSASTKTGTSAGSGV